jgi:hypothetical protein
LPPWHWALRCLAAIVGAALIGIAVAVGTLVIFGHELIPNQD